jgi:hypothetical protein
VNTKARAKTKARFKSKEKAKARDKEEDQRLSKRIRAHQGKGNLCSKG